MEVAVVHEIGRSPVVATHAPRGGEDMTDAIDVGYDRSEASWAAVRWAAAEAVLRDRRLRVITCDDRFDVAAGTREFAMATTAAYADVRAELDQARSLLRASQPGLRVESYVLGASCREALCDQSRASEMVVIGSSSRRGAAASLLGSTPRMVVRHAHSPVVVVRGASTALERVVVGIDASDRATDVLDWAIDEANLHEVPISVVHVWEYPYSAVGATDCPARDLMQVDADRLLLTAIEHTRERCAAAVEHVLLEGSPSLCLPTAVRPGDLLVLGSRGRGPMRSGVLGSTVNSVLDEVMVPVAVVPAG